MRIFLVFGLVLFVFGCANAQVDTLNQKDSLGRKQGYWIYTGEMKKKTDYKALDKVEEGRYLDDKKNGLWKMYYPGEILKSAVIWKNHHPNGNYVTYYDNGQIEERGFYKVTYYLDSFFRYHRNGKIAQRKFYNKAGKPEGRQIYYYENGEIEYSFWVKDGIDSPDSIIRNKIKVEKLEGNVIQKEDCGNCIANIDSSKIKNHEYLFSSDCNCWKEYLMLEPTDKLYRQIGMKYVVCQEGFFKNGKLHDGKLYNYDKNGILVKIEIYRKGKYVGDFKLD